MIQPLLDPGHLVRLQVGEPAKSLPATRDAVVVEPSCSGCRRAAMRAPQY